MMFVFLILTSLKCRSTNTKMNMNTTSINVFIRYTLRSQIDNHDRFVDPNIIVVEGVDEGVVEVIELESLLLV